MDGRTVPQARTTRRAPTARPDVGKDTRSRPACRGRASCAIRRAARMARGRCQAKAMDEMTEIAAETHASARSRPKPRRGMYLEAPNQPAVRAPDLEKGVGLHRLAEVREGRKRPGVFEELHLVGSDRDEGTSGNLLRTPIFLAVSMIFARPTLALPAPIRMESR